jgi:phosphate transport system substrate-binding protein
MSVVCALAIWAVVACDNRGSNQSGESSVIADGSSTVGPITQGAAELFAAERGGDARISVGISGTGGGFKRFLDETPSLRIHIANASRPISPDEAAKAAKLGVEFIELPIAYDGLAVVVHPSNDFCDHLTLEELKRIWQPGSSVQNWKDVRAGFPDLPLAAYGPGVDSGTFDYFTEVVCGKTGACRQDFSPSENDNMLVQGVSNTTGAIGYFGYSYYDAHKSKLKLLAIDAGGGKPIKPTPETVRERTYPLARPLFIYVNKAVADQRSVREFVDFYLKDAPQIVSHPQVNYIALSDKLYEMTRKRWTDRTTGTKYPDAASHAKSIYEIYGVSE